MEVGLQYDPRKDRYYAQVRDKGKVHHGPLQVVRERAVADLQQLRKKLKLPDPRALVGPFEPTPRPSAPYPEGWLAGASDYIKVFHLKAMEQVREQALRSVWHMGRAKAKVIAKEAREEVQDRAAAKIRLEMATLKTNDPEKYRAVIATVKAKRLAEYVNGAKQFLVRAVEKSSGKDLGSLALDYNKWCFMLKSLSDTDLISSLKDSKLNDGSFNTLVPSLKGRLLYHQRTGLAWLSSLFLNNLPCGLLADEAGLGKSAQVVALLAYLKDRWSLRGPHLVVAR